MGVIRKSLLCILVCLAVSLTSCGTGFSVADISLYGVKLSEIQANSAAAYYLGKDGTLYSPGADADAASFVAYQDPSKGIVAENVKIFGEMGGGGYYIDHNNDLYIWNQNALPLYGYTEEAKHTRILQNIMFATALSQGRLIYLDTDSNLYLIGDFDDESYSVNNPKLLAEKVVCVDAFDTAIMWSTTEGQIEGCGNIDSNMLTELNTQLEGANVSDIRITKDYVAVLSDGKVWFYGDYQSFISGGVSQERGLFQLSDNVAKISCSQRTIALLDFSGNMLLWGRCVSNDNQNTNLPQYDYYEKFCLTNEAENIFVSDSCICYIDRDGGSNIFYASGWPSFYGNATKDSCVGIKREPNRWIN